MRFQLPLLVAAVLCAPLLAGCETTPKNNLPATFNGWAKYGPYVPDNDDVPSLAALKGNEQDITISGTITDVCKVKGCWMKVKTANENDLFVQFKDYGFFVPRNSTGHEVRMHGVAEKRIMTVEMLRHYAHDANKPEAEINAITEPQTQVMFYADCVLIQGKGLEPPYSQ